MPSLASAPPPTPWRFVRARVHVSLTPQELSDPEAHAAQHAYRGLLLRHHPALGGVAVAHASSFRLDGPPRLIGASPFAHVAATSTLLVFAPPPGTLLCGTVQHVGPDHVGLAVHAVFHAVLPLTGLSGRFRYEAPDRWRAVRDGSAYGGDGDGDGNGDGDGGRGDELAGSNDGGALGTAGDAGDALNYRFDEQGGDWNNHDGADVVLGSRIRFAVASVKPTQSGLFQMLATLDGPPDVALGPLTPAEAARFAEAEAEVADPVGSTHALGLTPTGMSNGYHNNSNNNPDDGSGTPAPPPIVDIQLDGAARRRARRRAADAAVVPSSLAADFAAPPPASQEDDRPPETAADAVGANATTTESQQADETPSKSDRARRKRRRVSDSPADSAEKRKRKEKRGKKRQRESDGAKKNSLADAISRGMSGRRRAH